MTLEPLAGLLTAVRVIGYAGFVLWAGPLVFWSLVWPAGHRHSRLFRLAFVGALVLTVASVTEPVLRLTAGGETLTETASPLAGAAVLVRLALLVGSLFYLVDLVSAAVVGRRRVLALAAVVVVAATLAVTPAGADRPGPALAALATAGFLLASAAWLGGLIALALVVRRDRGSSEGDRLVSRFSPVATLAPAALVVAGGLSALAVAGGFGALGDGPGALVLLAKLGLLLVVLLLVYYAHRTVARLAFRRLYSPLGPSGAARDRTLALVVGAELAIAFAALSATVLVGLAT